MLHTEKTARVRPNFKPHRSITEELAEAMVDLNADGGATEDRLRERGFSRLELDMYGVKAREIAGQSFVRRIDTHAYDRPARIKRAANEIANLLPGLPAITLHLQNRSFTKFELDEILGEALAEAADQFAQEGGAQ